MSQILLHDKQKFKHFTLQQQQQQAEDDQVDRPHISPEDVQDTGEALQANPFTVSESFRALDEGSGMVMG